MRRGQKYATPTAALLLRLLREKNPVTRAVIADIISDRIEHE